MPYCPSCHTNVPLDDWETTYKNEVLVRTGRECVNCEERRETREAKKRYEREQLIPDPAGLAFCPTCTLSACVEDTGSKYHLCPMRAALGRAK